jgi:hypothetical protein
VRRGVGLTITAAIALVACGDDGELPSGDPVGDPMLPNLVPAAPDVVHMFQGDHDGEWSIRFSSSLTNTGEGEFLLRGNRVDGEWKVDQLIEHDGGGVEIVPTDATLVWGGDGHDHWHVERVATYRMVPIADDGSQMEDAAALSDAKVGFCFFDSHHVLERGPDERQFDSHSCGHEDDDEMSMGLSPGWADIYSFELPGQEIEISDLPDGRYRLWAEADARAWFAEDDRADNTTWADVELGTTEDGLRTAFVVEVGPQPE